VCQTTKNRSLKKEMYSISARNKGKLKHEIFYSLPPFRGMARMGVNYAYPISYTNFSKHQKKIFLEKMRKKGKNRKKIPNNKGDLLKFGEEKLKKKQNEKKILFFQKLKIFMIQRRLKAQV